MEIRIKQIKGKKKTECEDIIYKDEMLSQFYFIGVADGQSRKKYCREGGVAALKVVADYMHQQNLTTIMEGFLDEIQYELIKKIRDSVEVLANSYSADVQEFASTLCCFSLNTVTGDFVTVHLGDGCIIGLSSNDKIFIISAPENGFLQNQTYLTTSEYALSHIRLSHGKLQNYKKIYIITDGAECIYKRGRVAPAVQKLLGQDDFEKIAEYMESSNPRDDASIIMIQQ